MEPFNLLIDILKNRPDLFVSAFILANWWLERRERQKMQDANDTLQKQMLTQNTETKEALTEMNVLLQILTRGRH